MRRLIAVLVILVAGAAYGAQLTVGELLAAHRAGASQEGMISLIQSAESVAAISGDELALLRQAGVPEPVVQALLARSPQPTAGPAAPMADDPRLVDVVKLVKAGLSESLIAEQVRSSGEQYKLTVNDLIYLKENKVPESIIGALLESGKAQPGETAGAAAGTPMAPPPAGGAVKPAAEAQPAAPTPTPEPPEEVSLDGLVLIRSTFFAKNRSGKLFIDEGSIEWRDAKDSAENFSASLSGLRRVWMKCRPLPAGSFCYELGLEIFRGESYKFRDSLEEKGVNDHVMALREVLKERIPDLVVEERIKD